MQRKSKDEKAAILERYKNSGMSIKQFCLEAGIVEQNLRNWIKRSEFHSEHKQGFIEVVSNPTNPSFYNQKRNIETSVKKIALKILFSHGISIEIYHDTDREMLAWVLDHFQSLI